LVSEPAYMRERKFENSKKSAERKRSGLKRENICSLRPSMYWKRRTVSKLPDRAADTGDAVIGREQGGLEDTRHQREDSEPRFQDDGKEHFGLNEPGFLTLQPQYSGASRTWRTRDMKKER